MRFSASKSGSSADYLCLFVLTGLTSDSTYVLYFTVTSLGSSPGYTLVLCFTGPSSGSSADYTYAVADIKFSYGVELRDTGDFGFVLPPDQIIPTSEESFEGLKVILRFNLVYHFTYLPTRPKYGL